MTAKYCVIQTFQGVPRKMVVRTKATNSLISHPFLFNPAERLPSEDKHWHNMSTFSFDEALEIKAQVEAWPNALYTFVIPSALIFYNPKRSFRTFKPKR